MATNNNNISIFQKLEKFSGKTDDDLSSWLRSFERCCLIAGKNDDLVKGQLLTLCLCDQALAVVDRLEAEKKHLRSSQKLKQNLPPYSIQRRIKNINNRNSRIGIYLSVKVKRSLCYR